MGKSFKGPEGSGEIERKDVLSGIIETGMENITDGDTKDIIHLFESLCLPFDCGNGPKEKYLHQLLADYGGSYEENIGYVVHSVEETKRVVVSHIDLISLFNKGFLKDKKYKIGLNTENVEVLMGALDNTITNAIAVKALMVLRDAGKALDTTFLFTDREEIDSAGMKAYLRKYSREPLFINLDVTSDNREFHSSVEFDEPNWGICRQIKNQKKQFTAGFTDDRVGDDTDAVLMLSAQGFSYCIPTWKTIHSYSNYTPISNIIPYYQGLMFLISELDLSDGFEHDIKYMKLEKAVKRKTKEELLEGEKKAKKKKRERTSIYYGDYDDPWAKWNQQQKESDFRKSMEKDSFMDEEDFLGNTFFDQSDGRVQTEEEFIDSILSSERFLEKVQTLKEKEDKDPGGPSQTMIMESKIKTTMNEFAKRGYPPLVEFRGMLEDVCLGGGFVTYGEILAMVENNEELFNIAFFDKEDMNTVAGNILGIMIETLELRIISKQVAGWGI